ncbi:hypothetical protein LCGC14_0814810 [marine sediment metagenome]|uniref:Uncharacterized protein n=1 Tax=marine sediment metagenome TaxID=412755 RepID=A0A0F9Q5X1_9ZZZZ
MGILENVYLKWYYTLPTIKQSVGILDKYGKGIIGHIDFCGECCVVWVSYKTVCKAFSYK